MRSNTILPFALLLYTSLSSGVLKAQISDSTRTAWLSAARELMIKSRQCALITTDSKKQSRVRTMDPFEPDHDFIVWLGTNPKSRKVAEIKKNNRVSLYYADGENGYIALYGKAALINDTDAKKEYWKPEWEAFYPDRDQSYMLIKIVPSRIEIISYRHGLHGEPITWQPHVVEFKKP